MITLDLLYLSCMVKIEGTGAQAMQGASVLTAMICLHLNMPEALCFWLVCSSFHPTICSTVWPADKLIDSPLPRWPTNQVGPTNFPIHPFTCLSISRGFQTFSWEHMAGMACNLACWCILMTYKTDWISVKFCWFCSFWCYFDFMKLIKCKPLAATRQLYEWSFPSVCLSVCHTFFTMFLSVYHLEIFRSYYKW